MELDFLVNRLGKVRDELESIEAALSPTSGLFDGAFYKGYDGKAIGFSFVWNNVSQAKKAIACATTLLHFLLRDEEKQKMPERRNNEPH